ncbi:MAG: hypothetical protein JXA69_21435 [Phycisphaerae bacterium]|nr:hypothetical protein [Phycisphaerae bacterium]
MSAVRRALIALLTVVGGVGASAFGAADEMAASQPTTQPVSLETRVHELQQRLRRYRVDGDLRTHLFFRYQSEPYARATTACLILADDWLQVHATDQSAGADSRVLSDAVLAFVQGEGTPNSKPTGKPSGLRPAGLPMPPAAAESRGDEELLEDGSAGDPSGARAVALPMPPAAATLAWCDAAWERVRTGWAPTHRDAETGTDAAAGSVQWRLEGPVASEADWGRAIDLVACLGASAIVDARSGASDELTAKLAVRARYLGLGYRRASENDTLPDGRRAVLTVPTGPYEALVVAQWRAALWQQALAGRREFVLAWQPAGEAAEPSPWFVETAAHWGLDCRRLGAVLNRFPGPTQVAVLGRSDAQGSRSSVEAEAIRVALADVQIPADRIEAAALGDADQMRDCRVLILADVGRIPLTLQRQIRAFHDAGRIVLATGEVFGAAVPAGDGSDTIRLNLTVAAGQLDPLREYLVRLRDHGTVLADQVVPRSSAGTLVPSLQSRTVREADGRVVVALVNQSNRPVRCQLRRGRSLVLGDAVELISDRTISLTREPLALPAWAVWILRFETPGS